VLGVLYAVAVERDLVPQAHERAHLAGLLDEAHAGVHEERDPLHDVAESLHPHLPGIAYPVENGDRGRQREGQFLYGRRARLLQVIAADVDRVPLRHLGHRVRDQVRRQPQRVLRRERVGPAGQVLLDDVVLRRPGQVVRRRALLLGHHLVQRQQPHGGGVDRHRGVHLGQRDLVEEVPHVTEVRDRHADLADLAARQRVVGVVPGLGRQVERHRQAGLALAEVAPEQCVRLRRGRVAGVRPHHPGARGIGG
jgi:hypothetical protein